MPDVTLFLSTILLGLTIAVPVGPITILIMRRTLSHGMLAGMSAGMGAAMADALYAAIAAFGLTGIVHFLDEYALFLRIFGGLFLFWIAYGIWRKNPPSLDRSQDMEKTQHWKGFASIFALTLANPLTILGFVGVFSSLDPKFLSYGSVGALILTLGITIGSSLWQNIIAMVTASVRHALSPQWMGILNKASALILIAFALHTFWSIGH